MPLEITNVKRVFKYKKQRLPDPLPNESTSRVVEFYSNQYPELVNSKITGPIMVNDEAVYTIGEETGNLG